MKISPMPSCVRTLEKLWELEQKIAQELEMLSDLKKQIREVIEAVPDTDERMVLKYRNIHNYTWERIGMEFCADARTIRRWHGKALMHAALPDDPIKNQQVLMNAYDKCREVCRNEG